LFLLGYGELWLLILVSGIRSIGAGIQMPAVNAFLPQIAPTDKLIKVNSINGTLQPFIMIAAPITSGALLSAARLEAIFFVDVVTAILAVSLLLIWCRRTRKRGCAGYGLLGRSQGGPEVYRAEAPNQAAVRLLCVWLLPHSPGCFSDTATHRAHVRGRGLATNRQRGGLLRRVYHRWDHHDGLGWVQ
jgi:MFS family permease